MSLAVRVIPCLDVDAGRVLRPAGVTMGMLAQADVLDPGATVRDVVLGDLAEHEWASHGRVREIMTGLLGDLDASTWVDHTGVSGHPFAPGYGDQTEAWLTGETFPWAFTRGAVEAAAVQRLVLVPGPDGR